MGQNLKKKSRFTNKYPVVSVWRLLLHRDPLAQGSQMQLCPLERSQAVALSLVSQRLLDRHSVIFIVGASG